MKEYLESYAKEINSKFRRLNHLVSHGPTIGGYHEFIIRSFLRKFLSKRYGIKTGFIHSPTSMETSRQIDIVIVDENTSVPYYFVEEDLVVVDPKHVCCAIEIKTSLNRDNFNESIENHISLMKTGCKCPSLIFSFSSSSNLFSVIGSWIKERPKELHDFKNYPPAIFIMDRGMVQLVLPSVITPGGYHFMEPLPNGQSPELMVTSQFLSVVIKSLDKFDGKETDPFATYSSEASLLNPICHRFGHEEVIGKMVHPDVKMVNFPKKFP